MEKKGETMEKKIKTSDKVFNVLVVMFIIIMTMTSVLLIVGMYLGRQESKQLEQQLEQQAMDKLPAIEEKVNKIIESNNDIHSIKYHFEYDGINFIEAYVMDTWFYSADIEKKRFAGDIRDNVKAILLEEGFIKADDRVGIYVYSYDGISLAESKMNGEIKLK